MANPYYNKTYEDLQQLPYQERLPYYANNPGYYDREMQRIESVLAQNPDHLAGYRWKDQVKAARDAVTAKYNQYDLTKPPESTLTTIEPTYTNEIAEILQQIRDIAATPQAPIDVTQDPRYRAQQALMKQNVSKGQRQAMELMNERGLLMSDMTTDRMGQIEQEAMTGLNALVPALYEAITNERYMENQAQMQNLVSLLTGYQYEDQRDIQNRMAQNQLSLQERQIMFEEARSMRDYNLMVDTTIFNQDLAERSQAFHEQSEILTNAMNKVNTLGYVADQATADLLGVPVGTLSHATREAAANRQMQLKIANMTVASQERAEKSQNINQLLAIWQTSGVAPPGLENFGIQPGQSLHQTPIDELQNILALGEIAEQNKESAKELAIPDIQSQFGTDKITAGAIYTIWENPTKDSAMADYSATLKDMKKDGIKTKLVLDAIDFKWDMEQGLDSGRSYQQYLDTVKPKSTIFSPSTYTQYSPGVKELQEMIGNFRKR